MSCLVILYESMNQSEGIATDKVDRTKRVKEARDEAKKEIDEYRKSKDEEFKKFEAEVCCLLSFQGSLYHVKIHHCIHFKRLWAD
jgi:hypothetical protein